MMDHEFDDGPLLLTPEEPARLDRFLVASLESISRTKIAALIDAGEVSVDGKSRKAGYEVRPGMIVSVASVPETAPHSLEPADIPLDVVFEDEHLIVVDKPRGLPTHPALSYSGPTLVNALLHRGTRLSAGSAEYRPGIVHRLDKDTTGLIVVAKSDDAHRKLAAQIEAKKADRRYVAIAFGVPDLPRFRVEAPIGRDPSFRLAMKIDPQGRPAKTEFRVIAPVGSGTLFAVKLFTGRTHQIRVHLSSLGHPVKGDSIYAKGEWAGGPLQLHAAHLEFDHPATSARMSFYLPPGELFEASELVNEEALKF